MDLSSILVFISIGLIVVMLIIILIFYKIYSNRVYLTSGFIHKIDEINQSFKFHNVVDLEYSRVCKSKAQFDRFNYDNFFMAIIEEKFSYFTIVENKIKENRMNFSEYQKQYNNIKSETTHMMAKQHKVPYRIYKAIEKKYYLKNKKKARMNLTIVIRSSYVSPAGRNSYKGHVIYNFDKFSRLIYNVRQNMKHKDLTRYQRSLMTSALRYDILKRDKFRCQLCGASSSDGKTRLHVDHIIPVSKGGKTIKTNLRTLCQDCNLGKRDKIE